MEKNTSELLSELQLNTSNIDDFLNNNKDSFINYDIKNFWLDLIEKSNRSKSDIINKSDFNYKYFYDVINGKKIPTRDKIIRLCLSMQSGLDACQTALTLSGKAKLYPKVRRDSIIIYALQNDWSVFRCCASLNNYSEEELK